MAAPATIAANCSADVSDSLKSWLQSLPAGSEWDVPAGACYLVNEGIHLRSVNGLTVNGGTFRSMDPAMADPIFGFTGTDILRDGSYGPWVKTTGSQNVTLENMTIQGAWVPGSPYQADGAAIRSNGVIGLTITNVNVSNVTGDGINLEPLRAPLGSGNIQNPSENVTVSNVTISYAGRRGVAPVSVNGAIFTHISVYHPGLNSWDFEADQADEAAQNVVVNGCNNQGMIISSNAWFTGPITIENCVAQSPGPVAVFIRSTTGTKEHGQITFDHDVFSCHGSGMGQQCFTLTNAENLVVSNSRVVMTDPQPIYVAQFYSHATFMNDTVTGYSTPGLVSANSTVPVVGGTWTPAS